MLRLSKKVEYALIALKYFAVKPDSVFTAKEISDRFHLSYELLAKVLQKLKKDTILESSLGIHGGYKLNCSPDEISLTNVIVSIEGDIKLAECFHGKTKDDCNIFKDCTIKDPMSKIQIELESFFNEKKVSDLV